jgi:VWFA-related protein
VRRKFALLYFLVLAIVPAFAAKHVTVAQVEQVLASASGKPDAEVARQLVEMQLTERMSTEKLASLTTKCAGTSSKQALLALADASAFLRLPAAEISAATTPDLASQRQMIGMVAIYVLKTLPMLPNFFATRVTTMFEETPLQQTAFGNTPYQAMHTVNNSTVTVLYRDGREVVDAGAVVKTKAQSGSKSKADSPGLSTWGVFGPILGTVLGDVARANSLVWSYWAQTVNGQQAVYRYSVPKGKSHYQVTYCCVAPINQPLADAHRFEEISGYHGEISVDPANGTILRLTVQADLKPTDPINRADIAVEYGPVEIGGRSYIGPAKSVSISEALKTRQDDYSLHEIKQTSLNDVEFREYHLFRADVNILTAGTSQPTSGQPDGNSPAANPSTTEVDAAVAATPAAPPEKPAILSGALAPPHTAVVDAPEYSLMPADAVPHPVPNTNSFVLKASARLVDVGFVAYEKKGHPLTNLTENEIELFDNGKKQPIQLFYQAAPATFSSAVSSAASSSSTIAPTDTFTNQVMNAPVTTSTATFAPSSTVLLLDGAHLAHADLVFARVETVKFLSKLSPSQPVALYTMDDIGFHVLVEMTQDHALLASKLQSWNPTAAAVSRAQEADQRNNQHIDTVMNASSLSLTNGGGPDAGSDEGAVVDPQLRDYGANPAREAMRVLIAVARHLAPVAGHKSLIWISGDTALIDLSSQKPGTGAYGMKNKYLGELADKAGEALNQAHVSVYPLDASSVQVGGVDASLKNRNVELSQGAADNASMGNGAVIPRNMTNGRDAQAMQTNLYTIQEPVRRIAESTGGRAVGRASDLGHTLDTILSDTQATYMASFKPDSEPDDTFHKIVLKVTGKPGVTLRYRSGYFYEKESPDAKANFEQAVWRPTDVSDIGLSAKVVSHSPGKLQVTIALKDVALEQQKGRWTGKLDVYVVQRDEDSGRASSSGDAVQLALKDSSYEVAMKTGFAYERSLNAGPKTKSLRVIVYDENSGRLGSITLPASALQP